MKVNKKLKVTFILIERKYETKFVKFLKKQSYSTYFSFYGKGSASSTILDYLGIGETENVILLYLLGEEASTKLMEIIQNSEFFKHLIAFRVPIKGISSKKTLDHLLKEAK